MKRKIEEIKEFDIQVRHSNKKCKGCNKETQWSKTMIEWKKSNQENFTTICVECLLKKVAGVNPVKENK